MYVKNIQTAEYLGQWISNVWYGLGKNSRIPVSVYFYLIFKISNFVYLAIYLVH